MDDGLDFNLDDLLLHDPFPPHARTMHATDGDASAQSTTPWGRQDLQKWEISRCFMLL